MNKSVNVIDKHIEEGFALELQGFDHLDRIDDMLKEYQRVCRKYFDMDMNEGCYLYELVEAMIHRRECVLINDFSKKLDIDERDLWDIADDDYAEVRRSVRNKNN